MAVIENKWGVRYIQILPAPIEGATENIGKGFLFTPCKTSRILKIDVFKILDNKSIRKLLLKYELLFLD